MKAVTWTTERKDELKRLHKKTDLSTVALGEHFGVSKNAICGALNRMGLCSSDRNPIKYPAKAKRTCDRNAARRALKQASKRCHDLEDERDQPKVKDGCRFIAEDVKARPEGVAIDDLFCNAPLQDGSSYCEHHHAHCRIPASKKKRRGEVIEP